MAFKHELKRQIRSYAKLFKFVDVAAKAVEIHAAVLETAANLFPGPFTNPAIPRSVEIVFASGWAGGDVTVYGTNQFGAAISEVIADNPGNTVAGVKIFKTITSASKETVAGSGTDTCLLQTGAKIGFLATIAAAFGICLCGATSEAVTIDTTYHAWTPTTAPNGTNDYTLVAQCNYDHVPAE